MGKWKSAWMRNAEGEGCRGAAQTERTAYYDEIGLLKPSEVTAAGYRMYDDNALQTLQQILF